MLDEKNLLEDLEPKKRINGKRIAKYAGAGLLAAVLATGVGLGIYDTQVDHTQEICPITKLLSIPTAVNGEYIPDFTMGISLHQFPEMKKDYADKGIEDVTISFGEQTKKVVDTQTVPPYIVTLEDGRQVYSAPAGYVLTIDENGNTVCVKKIVSEEDMGYGFKSTWGETSIDSEIGYVFENEEYLRVR